MITVIVYKKDKIVRFHDNKYCCFDCCYHNTILYIDNVEYTCDKYNPDYSFIKLKKAVKSDNTERCDMCMLEFGD